MRMPKERKDSSAADTTKHTLAELLPGPDPTPPPKTPTPTNKNNGNNNATNNSTSHNGGGGGSNNCRNMMVQNPFDDPHGRPSPSMMQQMQHMQQMQQMGRAGHLPQGPHPQGPHPQGPLPQGPHPQGPHPQGPHQQVPHPQGPMPQGPHPQGPHPQGPHPQGPHPQGPQCGGMHPGMMMGPGGPGKVYPSHQPMVFNPSNPNAPPIYPCGICHKEVHENDQAILCESGCNFWFHRICTGLSEDAFTMLKSEVYAEWVCDRCLSTKNIPLVKFKP